MIPKPIKPRICKIKDMDGVVCGKQFVPFNSMQQACSPMCEIYRKANVLMKQADRKEAQQAKEQRVAHRAAKEKAKTWKKWRAEAQAAFNKFIRLRDADEPCISCGKTDVQWTVGGAWDCGHYLGVGAYPELRFEELNAHKQCKSCNGGSGKFAKKSKTVSQAYTDRLTVKIGADKVDWLNGPHEATHLSIDDFKEIIVEYKRKLKELTA